jgi:hypothetical protein
MQVCHESVLVAAIETGSFRAPDCMTPSLFSYIHVTVFFILCQRK